MAPPTGEPEKGVFFVANHPLPHHHGGPFEDKECSIPSGEDFRTAADLFKRLDDGNRLKIFWILCHGEECVMNLSALMDMSSPAVSHHLRQLRDAGLITSRRDGKEVYYQAADTEKCRVLHHAIEKILEITCPQA